MVDDDGRLIEEDQRAVVRYIVQGGYGADIVFAAGTTGEWDKLSQEVRQGVVRICAEEVRKINTSATTAGAEAVELWAGITAPSPGECLENLEAAIDSGADAAVVAPLSIHGVDDPVRFVTQDIGDLLDAAPRRIPLFLYDNANIAIDPRIPHIRTRQVKQLSRLDFVRGIKVSAPRAVLGHYTKAAASFNERGEFGIYVGQSMLIFDLFRPRRRFWRAFAEPWNRFRLGGELPVGVVAGHANALPREWARAWQVCRAGDTERMEKLQEVLQQFRRGTHAAAGKRTVACLKRALQQRGVIQSSAVAAGTPALIGPDARRFDVVLERVRGLAEEHIGAPWVSQSNPRST